MNKKYIFYTVITFVLSIVYVFGSMIVMDCFTEIKRERILSENGVIEAESPGRTWHDMLADSVVSQKEQIDEVESVLSSYDTDYNVINPDVSGEHISMETALETSMIWIDRMKIADFFSEGGWLGKSEAELVSKTPGKTSAEYAYWHIIYKSDITDISIYVNAVKNSVWNAEIILKDTDIHSQKDVDRFVEDKGKDMLGQFVESTGIIMLDEDIGALGITEEAQTNTSELVYGDDSIYAVTRLGYDSDIYARMDISADYLNEVDMSGADGQNENSQSDGTGTRHIKIVYSLQM